MRTFAISSVIHFFINHFGNIFAALLRDQLVIRVNNGKPNMVYNFCLVFGDNGVTNVLRVNK